jgi:hypothetical protein
MAPKSRPSFFWVLVFPLGLAACLGYRTPLDDPGATNSPGPVFHNTPGADARMSDTSPDLPHSDAPADLARPDRPTDLARRDAPADLARRDTAPGERPGTGNSDAAATAFACRVGSPYILVLGNDNKLYQFNPNTLVLTPLASVGCGSDTLNSMTVSPVGPAYISNHSGQLCVVDMTTLRAQPTSFNPMSVAFNSFGMALLPDNSPAGQTLYIAVAEGTNTNLLSRVDLTPPYTVNNIGFVKPDVPWAELTAGPNGELYGFAVAPTPPSLLLTIDPNTATALDVVKVPAGYTAASFALVDWQGTFYLFAGDGGSTSTFPPSAGGCDVYAYVKGDAEVGHPSHLPVAIIGAGVACR